MKSIKVTLDVSKDFKDAVLNGGDYVFSKTLDGCGAGPAQEGPGDDQIEFEMWEDGFPALEHWLNHYYPDDIKGITQEPC